MKLKLVNLFILFVFALAGCQELPPPYNDNERLLRETPADYNKVVIFKDWDKMDKRSYLRFKDAKMIHIRPDVDSIPPWLNEFKKAESLYVLSKKYKYEGLPVSVYGIKSLKTLMVSGCCVKKIDRSINNLILLEYLSLYGNQIKTLPEEIYELPSLKNINLRGNPLENPEEIRRRFEEKGVKVTL